jgi:ElaB/YqjD/DUF883 family membrane-anchored ribosome-binding protein
MPQEPQKPEEIRQEMDETRDSLTDKISQLETKVVETVNDATNGVKDTVQAVRDAVEDTVQTVRDTVGDTVDSVKDTFNLSNQLEQRPWLVMAGCVGIGFAAGMLVSAPSARPASAAPPTPTPAAPPMPRRGNGSHRPPAPAMSPSEPPKATFADTLTETFGSEINQLKGLAIGTLAGIVRDLVVRAAPEMVRNSLGDIIDDVTNKLGGQPIKGQVLAEDWNADERGPQAEPEGTPQEGGYRNPRQTSYSPN